MATFTVRVTGQLSHYRGTINPGADVSEDFEAEGGGDALAQLLQVGWAWEEIDQSAEFRVTVTPREEADDVDP